MRCPGLRFQKIEKHLAAFRGPQNFSAQLMREWAKQNDMSCIARELPGMYKRPGLPEWTQNNPILAADRLARAVGFTHSLIDHARTFRNHDGSAYVVVLQPYAIDEADHQALRRLVEAWTACPIRLNFVNAWWYPGKTVFVELWLHGVPSFSL